MPINKSSNFLGQNELIVKNQSIQDANLSFVLKFAQSVRASRIHFLWPFNNHVDKRGWVGGQKLSIF